VEFLDIMWRFYIIDYDVDPPHRTFTNITPWPANSTLRETYEDQLVNFFEYFIERRALDRVQHSGVYRFEGETYSTMVQREFTARDIKPRLQIYRKTPSADDPSEVTSSWDSFEDRRLSSIVRQANETVYKPLPKGARKALRTVDYYVFDVGIIREKFASPQPEYDDDGFYLIPGTPTNEFSDPDDLPSLPGNAGNNTNREASATHTSGDDDAQSVHTVFTSLSLGVPMARQSTPATSVQAPTLLPASTSVPVPGGGMSSRKRAVSGTASTSTSKRVISQRAASREGGRYQTRSKGQQDSQQEK
jgi:hypothetical protein